MSTAPLAASRPVATAGIAALGLLAGAAIAIAGVNALYLCLAAIGCAFILRDFRVGVVLLVVLMPVSRSAVFPHELFGVTGLNPYNLLLVATLGAWLLQRFAGRDTDRLVPRPLLWLYIVPFLAAGAHGSQHLGEIAHVYRVYDLLEFHDTVGYLREYVAKPLMLVVFTLLVGAAVARAREPERFLAPALASIWGLGALVLAYVARSGVSLGELAGSESRGFLSELGIHANDLGRLCAVAYALVLFAWAECRRPWLRFALAATMAMAAVTLVLTFSRGALVGFALVNALFVLWRFSARTLFAALLVVTAALLVLPEAVYLRLQTGFGEGWNAVSAGRIEGIWLPLLPDVARSPLYGHGLGSILWSGAMRAGGEEVYLGTQQAHNAYLEAVLDAGFVGLLLFCAYFAHVWKEFRALAADPALDSTLRGWYQGAMAGLASHLIAGVAGGYLTPAVEQSFLWLAIGMMYGQRACGAR